MKVSRDDLPAPVRAALEKVAEAAKALDCESDPADYLAQANRVERVARVLIEAERAKEGG